MSQAKESLLWAKDLAAKLATVTDGTEKPPRQEPGRATSQQVLARSFTARTRPYIESTAEQINATYEIGCFDACAVLIRRLVETLVIECFESNSIAAKIKGHDNNFLLLSGLIDQTILESDQHGAWNLSRNAKDSLKKLKSAGDLSAHNRRYVAHRTDIDDLKTHLRVAVQELVSIANIQRN